MSVMPSVVGTNAGQVGDIVGIRYSITWQANSKPNDLINNEREPRS